MAAAIGILAGGGDLPARLAEACVADGRRVFILALEGHAEKDRLPPDIPTGWYRIGAAGAILERLKREGVVEIVMAGAVRRPSLSELRPDLHAARVLARIGAKALGDDGLLRAVVAVIEEEGFRVVGVPDLIGSLLAPVGTIGTVAPSAADWTDIRRGMEVAAGLGALDVGQAVVVQDGLVLAVEAIEGTDALIRRCADLKRAGPGPVLVKRRKPQQDVRLDLPTVGEETVRQAAAAGFRGIALEAGGTILLGRERVTVLADAAGMFVVGIAAEGTL